MYLLDTNHCSYILEGNPAVRDRVLVEPVTSLSTCVIVEAELVFMAQNSARKQANIARVRSFLQDIETHPITSEIANIYGQFAAELLEHFGPKEQERRRQTGMASLGISNHDLWIACTAIHHDLTVVSSDRDFRRMQEVRPFALENWYSESRESN